MACGTCQYESGAGCGSWCSSSSGTCTDCADASTSCRSSCSNCSGCKDACSSGCTSCTNTCSGCGGACSSSCTGSCSGYCKDTCKNKCTDACNNGCTGSAMTDVYNELKFGLSRLIKAREVNDLKALIYNELGRRGMTYERFDDVIVGHQITKDIIESMYRNLINSGAKIQPAKAMPDMEHINSYVTVALAYYNQCRPAK